jgi:YHS domain-containing protein
MSLAGLATEYLFSVAGILPTPDTAEHGMVGRDVWGWNHTTVLDVLALVAFAAIYWLYRNRSRFGGGAGYAKDPVCGMQVQVRHAPAAVDQDGRTYFFCSDHCAHRFTADPSRFLVGGAGEDATDGPDGGTVDPVCGMTVDPATAAARADHEGRTFYFCNPGCRDRFVADPSAVLAQGAPHHH